MEFPTDVQVWNSMIIGTATGVATVIAIIASHFWPLLGKAVAKIARRDYEVYESEGDGTVNRYYYRLSRISWTCKARYLHHRRWLQL